ARVDAFEVVGADPLAPAVEGERAVDLDSGEARVADEDQMDGVTRIGQRPADLGDAHAQASGTGVGVWSFERQNDERRAVRSQQVSAHVECSPRLTVILRLTGGHALLRVGEGPQSEFTPNR